MARNEVISSVLGLSATVFCALRGSGYWALVVGQLTTTLSSVCLAWLASGWQPSRPAIAKSAWEDLKFGGNLTGSNLATYLTTSGDNIIVGAMAGGLALGLYDRSYRLVIQPLGQVISPISRVAIPLLSRLGDKPDDFRDIYMKIFYLLNLATLPLMIVCIITGNSIVDVVLGSRWHQAGPVFSWICVGGLASAVYSSAFWLFIAQARSKEMRRYTMAAAVINLLSYVVGAHWGIVGIAASAGLVFTLVTMPLVLFGATRSGPVKFVALIWAELSFVAPGLLAVFLTIVITANAVVPILLSVSLCLCVLVFDVFPRGSFDTESTPASCQRLWFAGEAGASRSNEVTSTETTIVFSSPRSSHRLLEPKRCGLPLD